MHDWGLIYIRGTLCKDEDSFPLSTRPEMLAWHLARDPIIIRCLELMIEKVL